MDRYELKVSIDEIDRLIDERRFREAAEIADTIDWKKTKSVQLLCRISDLYKINKRYADSREMSLAEVCRNALELFIGIHSVEGIPENPRRWTVPVCRPTGLRADPFAEEDWRARIYEDRGE